MDTTGASERTHEVLARGVCLREGQILLCRQKGGKRSFLPGGHVDPGEGAREALVREIAEELGLPSRAGRALGFAEHRFGEGDAKTWEWNVLFALEVDGLPAEGDPESREPWQEFFWWPLADLASAGFEPAVLRTDLPAWVAQGVECPFSSTYESEEKK